MEVWLVHLMAYEMGNSLVRYLESLMGIDWENELVKKMAFHLVYYLEVQMATLKALCWVSMKGNHWESLRDTSLEYYLDAQTEEMTGFCLEKY